jgi:predicted metal-dependent RNase
MKLDIQIRANGKVRNVMSVSHTSIVMSGSGMLFNGHQVLKFRRLCTEDEKLIWSRRIELLEA